MSAASVLSNAITLVECGWAQRAAARRTDGTPCGPTDPGAAAWCITGAIYHRDLAAEWDPSEHYQAERLVRFALGWPDTKPDDDPKKRKSLTIWNDTPERTADDVLLALNAGLRAALARSRQLFLPHAYYDLTVIGWRDALGNFISDDGTLVEPSTGIFMTIEVNEDTPTIPPPKDHA